ncbi:MAG: hypothetical protein HRU29_02090 [Rhizobiales bacterium]|nr:hypothetical protein [Hyphomicrobiales bacterium]NRB13167.1 hypothetical protein [Hyphomicrobiales bacterium]
MIIAKHWFESGKMLKPISIVFASFAAFSTFAVASIASANIAEDTGLIAQLNANLAAICVDETSAACVDAHIQISAAQNRIAVAQLINAAKNSNLNVAVLAQLELLASGPTSTIADVVGLLATTASGSLASIIADVAVLHPAILNQVLTAVATETPQLLASVVGAVVTAVPSLAANVVQAVVAVTPSLAVQAVQAALIAAPQALDDILEAIINADLSQEIQQQLAELIDNPSTAALGVIPTPS